MEITVVTREPAVDGDACRIVGVYENGALAGRARAVEKAADGAIGRVIARGDFTGRVAETLVLHDLPGSDGSRTLLVGLGPRGSAERWSEIVQAIATALLATGATLATTDIAESPADDDHPAPALAARLARAVLVAAWRFDGHARIEPRPSPALERLVFVAKRAAREATGTAVVRAEAIAHGMNRTRHLGDLAPNLCTPEYLADAARALAAEHERLDTEVLDESALETLGMGAMLAVARGSRRPPRLISMTWRGRKRRGPPLVVLGKGVTFDSGGISIKPGAGMDEMKYDMCGAATVFGVIEACCRLGLELDVIGVVAAVENMPDGDATRPGDVVTSMSGQTIEVLNTDAEGRLVLADALTWSARHAPRAIVDVATLTGACVVALGDVASGLFGNHDGLNEALAAAGLTADDPVWPLPLMPAYQKQLDSNFADVANLGGKGAGAVTAACFLSRFVPEDTAWAHLDIAGTAWRSGAQKGASGRPVALLMEWLLNEADGDGFERTSRRGR